MRRQDRLQPMSPQSETATSMLKNDAQFAEVVNLRTTEEGTLRSVAGPRDLIFRELPPYSEADPLTYGQVHAIGYARLQNGQRHVLLIQEGTAIRVFEGWTRKWRTIISDSTSAADGIQASVPEPKPGETGTQFVATATGIIIIPVDGRAYFYDGDFVGYLGYDRTPTAPEAFGPNSSQADGFVTVADLVTTRLCGTNDLNYASDGLQGWANSSHMAFKGGRLGTISEAGNLPFSAPAVGSTTPQVEGLDDRGAGVKGYLQTGLYRGYTQFIDRWGNLSPISQASADIRFDQQVAMNLRPQQGEVLPFRQWARADLARKRIAWSLPLGPRGTIGRILGRTRDITSSGDSRKFQVPLNAAPVVGTFATLPDNSTDFFPDNIPDQWLTTTLTEVDPVPEFRRADVAFDRLWIIGLEDDPGALMISLPGRWGTFPANSRRYPDPRGEPLVAIKSVPRGVLVFTRNSVFLYRSNDRGDDFIREPLNTAVGCSSPASVDVLPNGMVVWLSREGFYGYDGNSVRALWRNKHEHLARQHNISALGTAVAAVERRDGEYRCWVPVRGSYVPNRCYTTVDGATWRWRTDTVAFGVASCADDDQLVLVAGQVGGVNGVYVMDKGLPVSGTYLDSGWLLNQSGAGKRQNSNHIYVKLRETGKGSDLPLRTEPGGAALAPVDNPWRVQLEVSRDYRGEITQTTYKPLWPDKVEDVASFWDITPSEDAKIRRARPFTVRFDIDVASCESFRFKLSTDKELEILDVIYATSSATSGKREF